MANRRPDQASLHAEGCGCLVIGAEPGRVTGVPEVDPADLTNAIRHYVGADGPVWTPGYVQLTSISVLVIVINALWSGDRMFTLEKQITVTARGRPARLGPGAVLGSGAARQRHARSRLGARRASSFASARWYRVTIRNISLASILAGSRTSTTRRWASVILTFLGRWPERRPHAGRIGPLEELAGQERLIVVAVISYLEARENRRAVPPARSRAVRRTGSLGLTY
jgi:hypothetical protein